MKTLMTTLGAKAMIIATLGFATSAQAAPFNLAATAAPADGLLHQVGGSRGGRGDGVFGGAFPYSFRHGAFNYGQLGVTREQTLAEQGRFGFSSAKPRRKYKNRTNRKRRQQRRF